MVIFAIGFQLQAVALGNNQCHFEYIYGIKPQALTIQLCFGVYIGGSAISCCKSVAVLWVLLFCSVIINL